MSATTAEKRKRRRRGRRWIVAAVVLAVAAGSVTVVVIYGRSATNDPAASGLPPATATVTRASLAETETVDGTLNYGQSASLINRLSGTVTAVAAEGATVRRGQALYFVDQRPVALLYGSVPAYRALQAGATGDDVRQLEENLRELGYQGFTVDDQYTDATAQVVTAWQRDLKLDQTGVVELGRVVFLPDAVRVAQVNTPAGQPAVPDGPVLGYTSTARVVNAEVEPDKLPLLGAGSKVQVSVPGGASVTATVAHVGSVASADSAASPGQNGGGQQGDRAPAPAATTATFAVTFTLDDQNAAGGVDSAPVTIEVTGRKRENVLAVPVAALLALREGGYGVQLVEGETTRVVPVQTGLFARGLVEVSGPDIAEGAVVGVPAP